MSTLDFARPVLRSLLYTAMQTFQTKGCNKRGHREITVQFANKPVIPNGERLLVSYFEDSVARGVAFKPGQTIGIGGQLLRLKERSDGTLGVEELVPAPNEQWIEQIDRTIADVMIQRYVCDSVGLPLSYPHPGASCLMAECVEHSESLLMMRIELEGLPEHASGWTLTCGKDHDHGERSGLPLLALSALRPEAVKFLALPVQTTVLVMPNHRAVFHDGKQLTPLPGSYLEMLG